MYNSNSTQFKLGLDWKTRPKSSLSVKNYYCSNPEKNGIGSSKPIQIAKSIWNKKNESNSEQEEEEKELNPEISTEYFQSCINSHK